MRDRVVKAQKEPSLWILLLLVSFASVSAVLFTPALPELSAKLNITSSEAQFTITIFLLGYSIGNLPYGPLSNRFGRKRALYAGIGLALFGAVLTALVNVYQQFWLLILGRFLLALGSSAGITVAFTMLGDVYQEKALAQKIAFFMLMFAVAPNLSIVIGGFLTTRFGWVSCFYFLIAYSVFLLIATKFLPETLKVKDRIPLDLEKIKEGYLPRLRNTKLLVASALMGGAASATYLFASEAPFIGIKQLGLRADTYGLLNFIPPIGLVTGSILSHFFAGKKEQLTMLLAGITVSFVSSLAMLFLFLFGNISVWSLFLPVPFIYVGVSLVLSNASALALTHARNKANGSAMMSFINLGICAFVLLGVETVTSHQRLLMPATFSCVFFIMFFLRKYLYKIIQER
jgi:MFS family permease